jgi:gluconolactonase
MTALPATNEVFSVHETEFEHVLGTRPRLVKVADVDAHEGPVYMRGEHALYFTSVAPHAQVKRLDLRTGDLRVVDAGVQAPNGMTGDRAGWLVICEQGTIDSPARIARHNPASGITETVVDNFGGAPLNSPNDVVVKRDGTIWFTDPSYGHLQGFRPAPEVGDHVYRYDPRQRRLTVVADSFVKPNGIAFSPHEQTLYVTDSGANQEPGSFHPHLPHHIVAFDLRDGRHPGPGRLFAVTTPGFPDGLKVDMSGRVYASSFSGVQVFNPAGDLIGEIGLPGAVNFCFGGPRRNVLYITADTAVWAAHLAG